MKMFRQSKFINRDIRGKNFSINFLKKYGLFILENGFSKKDLEKLHNLRQFYIDESEIQRKKLSNIRGYELGNLAMDKCFIHKDIWTMMMKSETIKEIFDFFNIKKIEDLMEAGGNINFPKSTPQPFHRDSGLKNKYIMIFIALEKISTSNGAQEVIFDNNVKGKNHIDMLIARLIHGSVLLNMNPGDILIRYSSTWHRGTKNSSIIPRAMPVFSISLDPKRSVNKNKIYLNEFDKKISFLGNTVPEGRFRSVYVFLACKLNRFFHVLIYIAKLFKIY